MKEIKNILIQYDRLVHEEIPVALATVVNIEGSSYRRIGARMIIFENGVWVGGISGGCLEGDVLRKAKMVMNSGKSKMVTYDTRDGDPYQIGIGLGCRGKIDIFIESIDKDAAKKHFGFLKHCLVSRTSSGYALVMSSSDNPWELKLGDKIYLDSNANLPDQFIIDLKNQISSGRSGIKKYVDNNKGIQVLFEVFVPRIHIVLLGLHYDIPPMLELCSHLYWKCSLITNLKTLDKETGQNCDVILDYKLPKKFNVEQLDSRTAVLLMSHDYKTDLEYLKIVLNSGAAYIGILGPKKRFESLKEDLDSISYTLTPNDLKRLHSPVGLDIGAKTPEEISISIVAEVIAHFSERNGNRLKYRKETIHEAY